MATTSSVLAESRWEVLTLSGVGITAASVISDQRKFANALALTGVGIAWWVSYIEMGRAVAMDDAGINSADLMLVAGIIIYLPVTALALRAHQAVRFWDRADAGCRIGDLRHILGNRDNRGRYIHRM